MAEYINREQLIGELKDVIADYKDENTFSTDFAATIVTDILNNIVKCHPAADVEPVRHGRWVNTHSDSEFVQCSLCKYPVYLMWDQTNYCPNCGAKMDGGTN